MGLTVKYKLKKTWSFKITPYLYTRKWYQGNRPPVDRNKFCLRLLLLSHSCSGSPVRSLIQLHSEPLLGGTGAGWVPSPAAPWPHPLGRGHAAFAAGRAEQARDLMNDFFSWARAVCFYSPYKKIGNKLNKPSHTRSSLFFFFFHSWHFISTHSILIGCKSVLIIMVWTVSMGPLCAQRNGAPCQHLSAGGSDDSLPGGVCWRVLLTESCKTH